MLVSFSSRIDGCSAITEIGKPPRLRPMRPPLQTPRQTSPHRTTMRTRDRRMRARRGSPVPALSGPYPHSPQMPCRPPPYRLPLALVPVSVLFPTVFPTVAEMLTRGNRLQGMFIGSVAVAIPVDTSPPRTVKPTLAVILRLKCAGPPESFPPKELRVRTLKAGDGRQRCVYRWH